MVSIPVETRHAVRTIILAPTYELLLMQMRPLDGGSAFWITPGGGMNPGETVEQCARRELQEELGLVDFALGPLVWRRQHTFNWGERRICQQERYYMVQVARFTPHITDAVEAAYLEQFRWWPLEELAQSNELVAPKSLAAIVQRYLAAGPPRGPLAPEVLVD